MLATIRYRTPPPPSAMYKGKDKIQWSLSNPDLQVVWTILGQM